MPEGGTGVGNDGVGGGVGMGGVGLEGGFGVGTSHDMPEYGPNPQNLHKGMPSASHPRPPFLHEGSYLHGVAAGHEHATDEMTPLSSSAMTRK